MGSRGSSSASQAPRAQLGTGATEPRAFDEDFEGARFNELMASALEYSSQKPRGYSADQSDAVDFYQGEGYWEVNDILRHGGSMDADQIAAMRHLDAAMSVNPTKKDMIVRRGLKSSVFDGVQLGDVFQDKAFMSTTSGKNSSMGGTMVMQIYVPKGSKAIPIHGFGFENSGEAEILLPRGSKFRVMGFHDETTPLGKTRRAVKLELLP